MFRISPVLTRAIAFFGVYCFASLYAQQTSFSNIVLSSGTNDAGDSYGASWYDVNGDNLPDLFLARTSGSVNQLYLNGDDDTFTESAGQLGFTISSNSRFAIWGDADGDGDPDVYIGELGEDVFYRNDNGIFVNATFESGFNTSSNSYSGTWVDYDNDGDLDLFIANLDGSNLLYRNTSGLFEEVSSEAGMIEFGPSRAASWADFDNDGDMDVYVSRGVSGLDTTDLLYLNDGGHFSEVSAAFGITASEYTLGADWGDYDNDGDLDLYVATAAGQPNHLYRNDGSLFSEVTVVSELDDLNSGNSFTPAWLDYDNDSDLDLLVSRDSGDSNVLYDNNAGVFSQVQTAAGMELDTGRSISIAVGDYNEDGFLDVYFPNRFGNNAFFKNNGNSNSWLGIKLLGLSVPNIAAIGARVTVVTNGDRQIREVQAGSGQSSQHSLEAEFGLGSAMVADSVIVDWPSPFLFSRTVLTDVALNQKITIPETTGPFLVRIMPDQALAGSGVFTEIEAINSRFAQGNGVLAVELQKDGQTIAADSVQVLNDTRLQAGFSIPDSAVSGLWDLVVVGDLDSLLRREGGFTVLPGTPIAAITPDSIRQTLQPGDSAEVVIAISNLVPEGGQDLQWSVQLAGLSPEFLMLSGATSGSISPGNVNVVIARLSAPDVTDTTLQAGIEITLNDPALPSVIIPVVLNVANPLGLPGEGLQPEIFALERNYPNPFNPSTTITYTLPQAIDVSLVVYNMLGQRIRTLVQGQQVSGRHVVRWNGLNDTGNAVASGTYIYRLTAGRFQRDYKMILVK